MATADSHPSYPHTIDGRDILEYPYPDADGTTWSYVDKQLLLDSAGDPARLEDQQAALADRFGITLETVREVCEHHRLTTYDEDVPVLDILRETADEGVVHPNLVLTPANHLNYAPKMYPKATKATLSLPPSETREDIYDANDNYQADPAGPTVVVVGTGLHRGSPLFGHGAVKLANKKNDPPNKHEDPADEDNFAVIGGHETAFAGLVLQCAPTARIAMVRVVPGSGGQSVPANGHFTDADLALTLEAHRRLVWNADVVAIPAGGYSHAGHVGLSATYRELRMALAGDEPPIVVAAAGNDNTQRPFFPAAYPEVRSVGAMYNKQRAPFSNHGPTVQHWEDGKDVLTTLVSGTVKFDKNPTKTHNFNGYALVSGTSYATAIAAGRIAACLDSGSEAC